MKKNKEPEMREGLEDPPNPANSQHLCAKNVVHEEWGEGQPVHGMPMPCLMLMEISHGMM